jgi:hypothetical protein
VAATATRFCRLTRLWTRMTRSTATVYDLRTEIVGNTEIRRGHNPARRLGGAAAVCCEHRRQEAASCARGDSESSKR